MSSNLVKSLARVYDPKPLHAQKRCGRATTRRALLSTSNKRLSSPFSDQPSSKSSSSSALVHIEGQVNDLSGKIDKLLALQEASLRRLDVIGQDRGTATSGRSIELLLCDMRAVIESVRENEEQQDQRLDALERLVSSIQQVVSFIAEVLKHSRLADLLKNTNSKSSSRFREKDGKEKSKVYPKGLKTQKRKKPLEASDLVQAGFEEVQKLNQQNNQLSQCTTETAAGTVALPEQKGDCYTDRKDEAAVEDGAIEQEIVAELLQIKEEDKKEEEERSKKEEALWLSEERQLAAPSSSGQTDESTPDSCEENLEITVSTKRHVADETLTDDLKKSRVEEASEEEDKEIKEEEEAGLKAAEAGPERLEVGTEEERTDAESKIEEYVIDSSPPPPAPFEHRLVTTKTHQITSYYTINKEEVLGGGRFGMVHKCEEKSSGLILAAKIIKARSQKEKEVVKCEIEVMNQLNHANLIQLYAAFESRHEIILVME
ncbi:myosin light chain kinase family [Pimephales promelas]|nr:myosin light chain kinase family [Pimephales promelas]